MAHILYLSFLLVMRSSTFNGPFIIWNHLIILMSNIFNPPYIMPHVILKNALSDPPWNILQCFFLKEQTLQPLDGAFASC